MRERHEGAGAERKNAQRRRKAAGDKQELNR